MSGPRVEPVRFGFLAAGWIAGIVAKAVASSDRLSLVAVAARDGGRAEAFARDHGFERAYGSYEELLNDPEIECIYVSAPNSLHVDWTVRALEAGKHVLCEKPFSRHAAEAERAVEVSERTGGLVMEGFMYRHLPQTALVHRLVREGAIGGLRLIRVAWGFQSHETHVGLHPSLDGGALMVVGCYGVSVARLLAGEPESVSGDRVLGPTGIDTSFAATLRFAGGAVAQLYAALVGTRHHLFEVHGEDALLHVPDPFFGADPVVEIRRDSEVEHHAAEPGEPYRLEFENMSAAVRGEAEQAVPREELVPQTRVIEALHRSAEEQRSVRPAETSG